MSTERPDRLAETLTGSDGRFVESVAAEFDNLSALDATYVLQKCSANVGFDFANIGLVVNKVQEEVREVLEAFEHRDTDPQHYAEELGDCVFALVNLCRPSGLDPDTRRPSFAGSQRCAESETWAMRCGHDPG